MRSTRRLEAILLEQQEIMVKQSKMLADLLNELIQYRELSAEEEKLKEAHDD